MSPLWASNKNCLQQKRTIKIKITNHCSTSVPQNCMAKTGCAPGIASGISGSCSYHLRQLTQMVAIKPLAQHNKCRRQTLYLQALKRLLPKQHPAITALTILCVEPINYKPMGKQTNIRLRCTVANLIFYQWKGIDCVRTKPGPIKQATASKTAGHRFGRANTTESALRTALEHLLPNGKG
jgi:hypothetical protein